MKKLALVILFFTGAGRMFSQSSVSADDIIGFWSSNLDKGHVEITRTGDKYNGKIIWLKIPTYPDGTPKVDKNNPDKTKRSEPLIGLYALKDLVFVKDHWENGNIYDPESGKTYSCRATLKDDKLELRGYIGISQIGRTQTWVRVSKDTDTYPK